MEVSFNGDNTAGEFYFMVNAAPLPNGAFNVSGGFDRSLLSFNDYAITITMGLDRPELISFVDGEGAAYERISHLAMSMFAMFDFIESVDYTIISYDADILDGPTDFAFSRDWADRVVGGNVLDYGYDLDSVLSLWTMPITEYGPSQPEEQTIEAPADAYIFSEEELELYNSSFGLLNYDTGIPYDSGNGKLFFQSYYSNPLEMDIGEFVYYFSSENITEFTYGEDEEFETIKLHPEFYSDKSLSLTEYLNMGFNYYKIPGEDVDIALQGYMGVSLYDFDFMMYTLYDPYYDRFYTNPSDMGINGFTASDGYMTSDGVITLYNSSSVLTLHYDAANNFTRIYSYLPY